MQKPISVSIDTLNDDTVYISDTIKQCDDLHFTISMFQGSQSLNLTGQTIRVIVRRSNQKDTEITTGNNLLSFSNNIISVIFTKEYLVTDSIGDAKLEVVVSDTNGSSSSNRCIFTVSESLAGNLIVELDSKIDTLTEIDNFINNFNLSKEEMEAQIALAKQHIETLEADIETGTTLAERLELDNINGIDIAERLEGDAVTGNQLDSNLKQDFIIGIPLHNNLLQDIANGNYTAEQLKNANWPYIQSMFELFEKQFLEGQELTDEYNIVFTDENDVIFTI
jgi:archaellin